MKVTAAIIQKKPEYLNLQRTIEIAVASIEEAAQKGAQIIMFGETWLTGYPTWLDHCPGACLWDHQPTKEVFALLRENSPTIHDDSINILRKAAKSFGVVVVMGLNERVDKGKGNGTLYNSIITINTNGDIINHHRKLVPTFTERIIYFG